METKTFVLRPGVVHNVSETAGHSGVPYVLQIISGRRVRYGIHAVTPTTLTRGPWLSGVGAKSSPMYPNPIVLNRIPVPTACYVWSASENTEIAIIPVIGT